ncbi:DUF7002 family protein [Falsiroseomonas tokyonensis]|uniref:DUF7002 family protein n=1 Tax=Falsiroseomonas tokyonensis TaxID=430521 RepID=A0ABV7BR28_9PROT|nr:hypothetical protein [Falsiroseomonas tokyonensis]MBU8537117.1 hypothetical protein [Falsiroseomonas tokyonensis]
MSWDATALIAATGGVVWHLAPRAALPMLRRHGLLSTAALVRMFEVPEPDATRLLETNRDQFTPLHHPRHGTVELRRQQMWDSKLGPALAGSGTTPAQWRRHINGHVFFWLDPARLDGLAKADPKRPQVPLRIDLVRLLQRHETAALLTPINTGAVRHPRHRRSLADWHMLGAYADPRGRRPVELAIPWAVPDLAALVLDPWPQP